jgi:hypothetical protein
MTRVTYLEEIRHTLCRDTYSSGHTSLDRLGIFKVTGFQVSSTKRASDYPYFSLRLIHLVKASDLLMNRCRLFEKVESFCKIRDDRHRATVT